MLELRILELKKSKIKKFLALISIHRKYLFHVLLLYRTSPLFVLYCTFIYTQNTYLQVNRNLFFNILACSGNGLLPIVICNLSVHR